MTIDVLSETPAGPPRSLSAHNVSSDDSGNGGSQVEAASADKRRGQPLAVSVSQRNDKQQSYNISSGNRIEDEKSTNGKFENVLQRQLKSDKSNEEGEKKIVKKSQDFAPDKKAGQIHSIAGLVVSQSVAIPAENKQSSVDKLTNKQPVQAESKTLTQPYQNSSNSTQLPAKIDLVVKKDNLERGGDSHHNRLTSSEMQNVANIGQAAKLTTDKIPVDKQEQSQNTQQISPDAAADKTSRNNNQPRIESRAVKTNVPANQPQTDLTKAASPGNQSNIEKTAVLTGTTNQPASIQPKIQLSALSMEASLNTNNTTRVPNSSTAGGQRTGTETVNRDRGKNGAAGNKQADTHQFSFDGRTVAPVEKLNVEKVELLNDKNGVQKADSGTATVQSVHGQIMASGQSDVASVNRSMPIDRAATTPANSQTDTASDIRDQIYLAVQGSIKQGQQQITINLNPPELGRMSIKFSEQNNELTGLLETTNSQTRAEIRQALPEIIRSLEESGITVKHLDVTLYDSSARSDLTRQSAQQNLRDNASQDLWQQFGNQSFNDTGGNQLSYNSFVTPSHLSDTSAYGQSSQAPHQSSTSDLSGGSDKLLDVLI